MNWFDGGTPENPYVSCSANIFDVIYEKDVAL
jgi:hypothetical protein